MDKRIHSRTMEAIEKLDSRIVQEFETSGLDNAYFAPFLKRQARDGKVPEWIPALATFEWASHFVETFGFPPRPSEGYQRNPSLNLIWTDYDLLNSPETPNSQVLGIYKWKDEVRKVPIQPEWALLLDLLEDGPVRGSALEEKFLTSSDNEGRSFAKTLKDLVELGIIIEPISQKPIEPTLNNEDASKAILLQA